MNITASSLQLPAIDKPDFEILDNMQGWIVVRGQQWTWLELHLTAEVSWETERGTTSAHRPKTAVVRLDLPKRRTSSARWQGSLYNPPTGSLSVELPVQIGEEFTIHSYKWTEIEREDDEERVVRETTVRIKGKVLADDQQSGAGVQ